VVLSLDHQGRDQPEDTLTDLIKPLLQPPFVLATMVSVEPEGAKIECRANGTDTEGLNDTGASISAASRPFVEGLEG